MRLLAALLVFPACASPGSTTPPAPNTSGSTPSATATSTAPSSSGGTTGPGASAGSTSASGADASTGPASTGGTDASTGSDSTSGAQASDGGGATSCTPAFSDGFESDTAGAPPDQTIWHSYMGCNASQTPADAGAPGGGLLIGVDGSQHRSGNNSLRVVGTAGDGCGFYAVDTSAFASLGPQVYVRFYARFSGAPGNADAGMATQNHCGFLSMYSGSPASTDPNFWQDYNQGTSTGGQIRLGSQSNVIDWNDIVDHADTTLPDLGPEGIAQSIDPPSNQWECFELHVDQTTGHIELWYNGTAVAGLSWDGTPTAGVSDQWSSQGPPVPWSLQSFGLGWFGLNGAETAWYDDVAFASCRIGCE